MIVFYSHPLPPLLLYVCVSLTKYGSIYSPNALSLCHKALQVSLLDPSSINGTWNFYCCCYGFTSKNFYQNKTSKIETWDSLFIWQQQYGIDKTTQTIIVVTKVPYTFGTLMTQNIMRKIRMFCSWTRMWNKISMRRQGSGFSNYASFYFDYSRTMIMDFYIQCLFILKKLGRTNIHGLKP